MYIVQRTHENSLSTTLTKPWCGNKRIRSVWNLTVPVEAVVVEVGAAASWSEVAGAALDARVHGQIIPVLTGVAIPTRGPNAIEVVRTAVQRDSSELQPHPYTNINK
jgi:hypothetical protein